MKPFKTMTFVALVLAACTAMPVAETPKTSCPIDSDQVAQVDASDVNLEAKEELCKAEPQEETTPADPSIWMGGFG